MEYVEVKFIGISGENAGIMTALMCELGFESFTEESGGMFSAYIPLDSFDIMKVANFLEENAAKYSFGYKVEKIAQQNWNAAWESAYHPVRIGKCFIRAPFHEPDPSAAMDLVIEPKMSFGTAHHETTRLMIQALLECDLNGLSVLDMGTGTGVLGIVAAKLGAGPVVEIDNDDWSFLNAKENTIRNNEPGIVVIHGDSADIPAGRYGFILANINRNVLLRNIPLYHTYLDDGGFLLISGFYEDDLGVINEITESLGMKQIQADTLDHWAAVRFKKC